MEVINILGTDYTVEKQNIKDNVNLKGRGGYIDKSVKKIYIRDFEKEDIDNPLENLEYEINESYNHELFHALFHEAGLNQYYSDETLVDALAVLVPKIKKYIK